MSLTRSEISAWDVSYLDDAATRWRAAADESDRLFSQYRQTVGDADWTGEGRDTAYDRLSSDTRVVQSQSEVQRAAATIAQDSAADQRNAVQKTVTSISDAEADGFEVAENLSVRDARKYDITTIVARNKALAEHAENIRWNAEQLVQADALVGQRLQEKAAELEGVRFDGGTVQAASFGGFKQDGPPMLPPDHESAAPTGPPVLHGYDPRIAGLPPVLQDYVSGQLQGKPLPQPPVDPVTEQQLRERLRTQQEILDLRLAEFQRKYGVSCTESEIYTKIAGVLATGAGMGVAAPTALTPPGAVAEIGGIISLKAQIDAIHKCFGSGA